MRPELRRFATWLKKELVRQGMSQNDLAERVGTSSSAVSRWARGLTKPEPGTQDRIADALRFDRDFVLDLTGDRPEAEALGPDKAELVSMIEGANLTPDWIDHVRVTIEAAVRGSEQAMRPRRPTSAAPRSRRPTAGTPAR